MNENIKPLHCGRIYPGDAIDTLPETVEMPGHEGHLYIAEFTNGTVKVGISSHPRSRVRQHDRAFEPVGVQLTQVWLSVAHSNYTGNERCLVEYGANSEATRVRSEYFVGASFEAFVRAAQSLRYTPLDHEAAKAKADAQRAVLRAALRPHGGRVSVSEAYFHEAEQWMALVNGILPDGTERPRVDRLRDSALRDFDAYMELAGSFEESMGLTTSDVLQMNYIDLIEVLLEAKVRTAMNLFRRFAIDHDRDDLLKTTWEHIERIEGTA